MKRNWRIVVFCAVLAVLLPCSIAVSAASESSSLANFQQTRTFDTGTFSDVSSNAWFYPGVKACYEYSLMNGTAGDTFDPDGKVTLSQAIAIAARVHAVYYGNTIPETGAAEWYAKFYDYAKTNNLLPPDVTAMDGIDATNATRRDMAYLFSRVVSPSDLESINTSAIPDLDSVAGDYKPSVSLMYSAGIITGKANGNFDPEGFATRAETATIITRLTDKFERAAYDSKFNYDMEYQESNLKNNGLIAYDENYSYHVIDSVDFPTHEYRILRRDSSCTLDTIYFDKDNPGEELENLVLYNGYLYFQQIHVDSKSYYNGVSIYKINLQTKAREEVYRCSSDVLCASYTIYNGDIYVENMTKKNSKYYFDIGKVATPSSVKKIYSGQGEPLNISIYDSKLYFDNDKDFYQIDLSTGTAKKILTLNRYTICKNILYYLDDDGNIYKCFLNNPSNKKLITSVGSDLNKSGVMYLNAQKNKLYFCVPLNNTIYCIPSNCYTKTQDLHIVGYGASHTASLCVMNGNMFYTLLTEYPSGLRIADTDKSTANDLSVNEWLKNKRFNRQTTGTLMLPETIKDMSSTLDSQQIYSQCSSAVFSIQTFDKNNKTTAYGSGFFINPNGIAVTNYHVIKGSSSFTVTTSDGKKYEVEKIIAVDYIKDIAIIKVSGSGFNYLSVGDSDKIAGGQKIYALGSPQGLSNTITEGIVSNPKRDIAFGDIWIQISAAISAGSSGGALINQNGEVIGITCAGITTTQGLNFAIPINDLFKIDFEGIK